MLAMVAVLVLACQPIRPAADATGDIAVVAATGGSTSADSETTAAPTATVLPTVAPTVVPTVPATVAPEDASTPEQTETAIATTIPAEETALGDPDLIALGRQTYLANYCGTCHRLADAGTAGVFGPNHDGMGTIAQQRVEAETYTGQAEDAADYIRESIVEPYAYFVPTFEASPHRMPAYGHLEAEKIEAMVAYLLAQE